MEKLDLRIQRTYRLLHDAFTDLMEEKRFEDITVGELCERAMIRRTTFYKHFADKYEYVTFYMQEIKEQFEAELLAQSPVKYSGDYYLNMSRQLIRFFCQHQQMVKHAMESAMFPMLFDSFTEQVFISYLERNSMQDSSEPRNQAALEVKAAFFAGGFVNAIRWWLEKGKPIDEEQFITEIEKIMASQPILTI